MFVLELSLHVLKTSIYAVHWDKPVAGQGAHSHLELSVEVQETQGVFCLKNTEEALEIPQQGAAVRCSTRTTR